MANPNFSYGAGPTVHNFDTLIIPGLEGYSQRLQDITRPNVDGTAWRKTGLRGRSFPAQSLLGVTSAANAKTLIHNYELAPGNFATVTLDTGQTLADVLIEEVRNMRYKAVLGAGGYLNDPGVIYEVTADWTLVLSSATPVGV